MADWCILTPIRFDAASYVIRVKLGSTSEDVTVNVTVGRDYWLSGDGTADSSAGNGDLLKVITDAITSGHSGGGAAGTTASVVFQDGRPFVRFSATPDIKLAWSGVNVTFDPTILGWETGVDSPEQATITAPNRMQGLWAPQAAGGPDSRDRVSTLRGVSRAMDGTIFTSDFGDQAEPRDVNFELLNQDEILEEYAVDTYGTAGVYDAFEIYWRDSISKGRRMRIVEDVSDLTTFATYVNANPADPKTRNAAYPVRWDVALQLVRA